MTITVDLTEFPLWAFIAYSFAVAAVGGFIVAIAIGLRAGLLSARQLNKPMPAEAVVEPMPVVVKPWSERGEELFTLPPVSRWARENEPTPLAPVLEPANSIEWKHKPFRPTRDIPGLLPTGEWKVVEGMDDLDVQEPEPPKQMPGFEVEMPEPKARSRFTADKGLAAKVAKVRDKQKPQKVAVDLEAGTVVVSA